LRKNKGLRRKWSDAKIATFALKQLGLQKCGAFFALEKENFMNFIPDQSFFEQMANLAASQSLPYFRTSLVVDNKAEQGFDPVTKADRETERVLRERNCSPSLSLSLSLACCFIFTLHDCA